MSVRRLFAVGLMLVIAGSGCSSDGSTDGPAGTDPAESPTVATEAPAASSQSDTDPTQPATGAVVSDVIPSIDELLEMGLSRSQAECFVEQLDPEGTGRLQDADLFATALVVCLG